MTFHTMAYLFLLNIFLTELNTKQKDTLYEILVTIFQLQFHYYCILLDNFLVKLLNRCLQCAKLSGRTS